MTHSPREVIPGVFAITLPLPFELNHINLYLIRLDDGYLLVDCGLGTDASFQALEDGLRALGIGFGDIRRILLTHTHPDHVGQAPRLLSLTGARLLMHPEEAALLAKIADSQDRPHWLDEVLEESGVPAAMVSDIHAAFAKFRKSFRKLDPDALLAPGEMLATAIGELEVLWTPGHSPGHVCLYSPERRVLLSGDHMLPGITPNIGWLPGQDTLADYLSSLDLAESREVDQVIPSHGEPFDDHRGWIRDTRAHHADRCQRIVESIAQTPKTVHEMVGDLWNFPLSPFNHRFAIFEVLAHLVYLERQGRVAPAASGSQVRWSPATAR